MGSCHYCGVKPVLQGKDGACVNCNCSLCEDCIELSRNILGTVGDQNGIVANKKLDEKEQWPFVGFCPNDSESYGLVRMCVKCLDPKQLSLGRSELSDAYLISIAKENVTVNDMARNLFVLCEKIGMYKEQATKSRRLLQGTIYETRMMHHWEPIIKDFCLQASSLFDDLAKDKDNKYISARSGCL